MARISELRDDRLWRNFEQAIGALKELTVEPWLRLAARPSKSYPGKCFEMSYRFVLLIAENAGPGEQDRVRLIHGTYGLSRENHAWVEIDDTVAFDPNVQRFYDRSSYRAATVAIPHAFYTPADVFRYVLDHGHYGPWQEKS